MFAVKVAVTIGSCVICKTTVTTNLTPLTSGGVYHPNQTLNDQFYISGESYTGLCLAILQ